MSRQGLCCCLLFLLLLLGTSRCVPTGFPPQDLRYPRQVHLSLAVDNTSMTVTWTTFQVTNGAVQYSLSGSNHWESSAARRSLFVDGGDEHRKLYMFRATMSYLKPAAKYYYRVGDMDGGWSDMFYFSAPNPSPKWSPTLAIYGDLGNSNGRSIGRLQTEAQLSTIDAVIHTGDFAYNMDSDNARTGDQFMDQIQSIAAYVPYMTAVGNHEHAYNFSNYRNRFSMPGGDGEGLWYSFDYGPAHFIAISTEVYFYVDQGKQLIYEQKLWLQRDLEIANKRRSERPWVIMYGHRPMYCSNSDQDDCTRFEGLTRFAFEDLAYKAGVDVLIWAHEHSYERLYPLYNRRVCNGSGDNPYTEPRAPVHITTGSAGMFAHHDPFIKEKPFFTAFRSLNYGYTRLHLLNSTHIHLEQIDDEQDGKVIDSVTIVKSKHGPGLYDCHTSNLPRF